MSEDEILEKLEFLDRRIVDVANQIGRWMKQTDKTILARIDNLERSIKEELSKERAAD